MILRRCTVVFLPTQSMFTVEIRLPMRAESDNAAIQAAREELQTTAWGQLLLATEPIIDVEMESQ